MRHSRPNVDFGPGFYLTSELEQARQWARIRRWRADSPGAFVSVFSYDEALFAKLKTLHFEKPERTWLKYVAENRRGTRGLTGDGFDVVSGPVADDKTNEVLGLYLAGRYTEQEAIDRLLPMTLNSQYAFKTAEALAILTFKEVIRL